MARASAVRCCWPPESSCGRRPSIGSGAGARRSRATRRSISGCATPATRSGEAMLSKTVMVRVVDEELVDQADVALARDHAGHVAAVEPDLAGGRASRGPAISLISVVLPAPVAPRSTLKPSGASVRLVSWMWVSAPTRLVTRRQFEGHGASGPRSAEGGRRDRAAGGRRFGQLRGLGPDLDHLVVADGLALRLLVLELGLRAVGLAEPLGRVDLGVQPRAAAAVDVGRLVGLLHAGHGVVHLGRRARPSPPAASPSRS